MAADGEPPAHAERRALGTAVTSGPLNLAIDASAATAAALAEDGFAWLARFDLVAPPLLWSEVRSTLHEAVWRRELPARDAWEAVERLQRAPITPRVPAGLGREAWHLADELGWAKIYDAEYVALARLLRCKLLTQDARLLRRTAALGLVVAAADLQR